MWLCYNITINIRNDEKKEDFGLSLIFMLLYLASFVGMTIRRMFVSRFGAMTMVGWRGSCVGKGPT